MKSFSVEERVTTRERVLWTPGHIFQLSYHAMSTCKQYFLFAEISTDVDSK